MTAQALQDQVPKTPNVPPAGPSTPLIWRIRYGAVCVVLAAFTFNSSSGALAPDTKLDLTQNPVGFLSRALHLWDARAAAGQVQNQAYGYLFPMGPFFVVGKAAHLPMWAVQRLWWSVLICVAFTGVIALARRLDIGTPASRLIAGLAYGLSPHVLSVLGPVSAEALPMCLAPWVLVPLVTGAREGSPRRAAMRSGVAVLCMGAINAALVVAALIPAALWLITRRPERRARRLAGAWVLAVALATAWWVAPLLLFGRYTAPFLGHIESASTTTSTATLVEALRGTADWVAYLPTSGWRAGFLLLTEPAVIVNTVVVVVIGLAALAGRDIPHRGWLLACLFSGVVLICAGRVGSVDGLLAGPVRSALDGTFAPLRNVHKFDVVLRLPLVLGLAHLAGRLSWGTKPAERRVSRALVLIVAAGAVAGMATPVLALRLAPAGRFTAVPDYWKQAAAWLGDHPATGRSLLLPGTRFGQYLWGAPLDEPLQPLASAPWDVRDAVPGADAGHVRMLDAVDAQLATGHPSAGLAAYLARNGVRYLVVRNDLDLGTSLATRPVVVHETLQDSPGLSMVASFGGRVGSDNAFGTVIDQHLDLPYFAVEIWQVAADAEWRVAASPLAATVQVSGGPESLLPLSDAGLLAGQPTVLTGDLATSGLTATALGGGVTLTDGLRRREADFGSSPLDTSATLTVDDPRRMSSRDRDILPFADPASQSYAQLSGATSILASSSRSDPDAFGGSVHADQPYAAFDGDPRTSWQTDPISSGIGQWLQIDFGSARDVSGTTVTFTPDSTASRIQVRTDTGTASSDVAGTAPITLHLPTGATRTLRLTVTGVSGRPGPFHLVGIAEVAVPGLHVERTIVMPTDLSANQPTSAPVTSVLMTVPDDARNGCVLVTTRPLCAVDRAQLGEESTGIDRTLTLPAAGSYVAALTATPIAGPALDAVLQHTVAPTITATASSQAIADPLAGAQTTVDHDLGTGWIATATDPAPALTLHWSGLRTVSSLTLVTDPLLAATRPDAITIRSPAGVRTVTIPANGVVQFAPLRTDSLTLELSNALGLATSYDPVTHSYSRLGVGVSEIAVDGIAATARADSDPLAVRLPCGSGPDLVVDGSTLRSAVNTTVGALRDLRPVPLTLCGDTSVELSAGQHRVRAMSNDLLSATSIAFDRPAPAVLPASAAVQVRTWGTTHRSVSLGAREQSTLLVVHENANSGWRASLAGRRLRAVTVDGWQQGYVVPAGAAAVVRLDYTPDTPYRAALLLGLVAALVLLGAAAVRGRRRRAEPAPSSTWRGEGAMVLLALPAALLCGGLVGAAVWVAIAAVGAIVARWRRRDERISVVLPATAASAYLAAGLLLAMRHWGTAHYVAGTAQVQLLCLIALMATASSPWPRRRPAPAQGSVRHRGRRASASGTARHAAASSARSGATTLPEPPRGDNSTPPGRSSPPSSG